MTAIAADSTGEIPTAIAVRDGPMTPTERVNRIWLIPGANSPVRKNGHVFPPGDSREVSGHECEQRTDDACDDSGDERCRFRIDAADERETDRDGEGAEEERRAHSKEDDQNRGGEIRTRDFCLPKAAL